MLLILLTVKTPFLLQNFVITSREEISRQIRREGAESVRPVLQRHGSRHRGSQTWPHTRKPTGGARKPVCGAGPRFWSRLEDPGFSCFALMLHIVPGSPGPGGHVCAEEDGTGSPAHLPRAHRRPGCLAATGPTPLPTSRLFELRIHSSLMPRLRSLWVDLW